MDTNRQESTKAFLDSCRGSLVAVFVAVAKVLDATTLQYEVTAPNCEMFKQSFLLSDMLYGIGSGFVSNVGSESYRTEIVQRHQIILIDSHA